MKLLDVNVLVHSHREDSPRHADHYAWLRGLLDSDEPFGLTSTVLTGFVRIATHRRVFDPPSPMALVLAFADELRSHVNCVPLEASGRHWQIFKSLCTQADARGNLVTDAHLAALAIETGSELVSSDRDFARFPRLRWTHPLS
jgi:toxin-antitoxin system PIN domain toxin